MDNRHALIVPHLTYYHTRSICPKSSALTGQLTWFVITHLLHLALPPDLLTRLVPLIPVGVFSRPLDWQSVRQTTRRGLGVKEDEHVYVYYTCSTYRPNFSCNTYYDGPPNYTASEGEGGRWANERTTYLRCGPGNPHRSHRRRTRKAPSFVQCRLWLSNSV